MIGRDGHVAYRGGRGRMFFEPPEWERAIEQPLAESQESSIVFNTKTGISRCPAARCS